MDDPQAYPLLVNAMSHARSCVADLTEPEEDIMPVLLWVGPYGMGVMPLLEMGDADQKDALAAMMTTTLACSRAVQAVMITTSWMVQAPPPEGDAANTERNALDALGCMPSEHPDRVEAVTAMYASIEDGKDTMSHAVLTRFPDKPPLMNAWESMDEPMEAKIGGRFGDAIHLGMNLATQMPPEMVGILDQGWEQGEQEDLIKRFHKVLTGSNSTIGVEIMDMT